MKIIRVFPRRTSATPNDDLVRIAESPGLFDECDEVHVSVTWTWDLPLAERIVKAWSHVAPVKLGGPATGERGGDFVPGRYIKHGYVITSRWCPNRCWFCSVWKREGHTIRELPIVDGWNVLDDNLLACSPSHIDAVFAMLKRQKRRAGRGGGLVKNPAAVSLGRLGGRVKCAKGFASPAVLAKALATRRANRLSAKRPRPLPAHRPKSA